MKERKKRKELQKVKYKRKKNWGREGFEIREKEHQERKRLEAEIEAQF